MVTYTSEVSAHSEIFSHHMATGSHESAPIVTGNINVEVSALLRLMFKQSSNLGQTYSAIVVYHLTIKFFN